MPGQREADGLLARLAVHATAGGVSRIRAGRQRAPGSAAARRLVARARRELGEYLAGTRVFFSVPVDLSGVPAFQRKVLRAAAGIPFGQARPYAWVARRIGHPQAARAVGTALGRNPLPILVPCHRVLRGDGGLGGYLFGLGVKARLLGLERGRPVLEGCRSTRIVCRVGCVHGRHMRPENRVVFASLRQARSAGYRPCRVCRPTQAARARSSNGRLATASASARTRTSLIRSRPALRRSGARESPESGGRSPSGSGTS